MSVVVACVVAAAAGAVFGGVGMLLLVAWLWDAAPVGDVDDGAWS